MFDVQDYNRLIRAHVDSADDMDSVSRGFKVFDRLCLVHEPDSISWNALVKACERLIDVPLPEAFKKSNGLSNALTDNLKVLEDTDTLVAQVKTVVESQLKHPSAELSEDDVANRMQKFAKEVQTALVDAAEDDAKHGDDKEAARIREVLTTLKHSLEWQRTSNPEGRWRQILHRDQMIQKKVEVMGDMAKRGVHLFVKRGVKFDPVNVLRATGEEMPEEITVVDRFPQFFEEFGSSAAKKHLEEASKMSALERQVASKKRTVGSSTDAKRIHLRLKVALAQQRQDTTEMVEELLNSRDRRVIGREAAFERLKDFNTQMGKVQDDVSALPAEQQKREQGVYDLFTARIRDPQLQNAYDAEYFKTL